MRGAVVSLLIWIEIQHIRKHTSTICVSQDLLTGLVNFYAKLQMEFGAAFYMAPGHAQEFSSLCLQRG